MLGVLVCKHRPGEGSPATVLLPAGDVMGRVSQPRGSLSPHWSFVIQLREGTSFEPDRLFGRIEHVTSGRAIRFESLAEVMAFMEQVLWEQSRNSNSI